MLPRLLYVPTEDMPADKPSRGIRARPNVRRVLKKRGYSKTERSFHQRMQALERAADLLGSFGAGTACDTSSLASRDLSSFSLDP